MRNWIAIIVLAALSLQAMAAGACTTACAHVAQAAAHSAGATESHHHHDGSAGSHQHEANQPTQTDELAGQQCADAHLCCTAIVPSALVPMTRVAPSAFPPTLADRFHSFHPQTSDRPPLSV